MTPHPQLFDDLTSKLFLPCILGFAVYCVTTYLNTYASSKEGSSVSTDTHRRFEIMEDSPILQETERARNRGRDEMVKRIVEEIQSLRSQIDDLAIMTRENTESNGHLLQSVSEMQAAALDMAAWAVRLEGNLDHLYDLARKVEITEHELMKLVDRVQDELEGWDTLGAEPSQWPYYGPAKPQPEASDATLVEDRPTRQTSQAPRTYIGSITNAWTGTGDVTYAPADRAIVIQGGRIDREIVRDTAEELDAPKNIPHDETEPGVLHSLFSCDSSPGDGSYGSYVSQTSPARQEQASQEAERDSGTSVLSEGGRRRYSTRHSQPPIQGMHFFVGNEMNNSIPGPETAPAFPSSATRQENAYNTPSHPPLGYADPRVYPYHNGLRGGGTYRCEDGKNHAHPNQDPENGEGPSHSQPQCQPQCQPQRQSHRMTPEEMEAYAWSRDEPLLAPCSSPVSTHIPTKNFYPGKQDPSHHLTKEESPERTSDSRSPATSAPGHPRQSTPEHPKATQQSTQRVHVHNTTSVGSPEYLEYLLSQVGLHPSIADSVRRACKDASSRAEQPPISTSDLDDFGEDDGLSMPSKPHRGIEAPCAPAPQVQAQAPGRRMDYTSTGFITRRDEDFKRAKPPPECVSERREREGRSAVGRGLRGGSGGRDEDPRSHQLSSDNEHEKAPPSSQPASAGNPTSNDQDEQNTGHHQSQQQQPQHRPGRHHHRSGPTRIWILRPVTPPTAEGTGGPAEPTPMKANEHWYPPPVPLFLRDYYDPVPPLAEYLQHLCPVCLAAELGRNTMNAQNNKEPMARPRRNAFSGGTGPALGRQQREEASTARGGEGPQGGEGEKENGSSDEESGEHKDRQSKKKDE